MQKSKLLLGIKIFILVFIALNVVLIFRNPAFAGMNLNVISQGSSIRTGNITVQSVAVSMKTKRDWKLLAVVYDNSFVDLSHPSAQIPVNKLSIQDDSSDIHYFEQNKPIILASGSGSDKIDKNFSFRFYHSDADYPGIYRCNIQFILTSSFGTENEMYTFDVNQPLNQSINIMPDTLPIDIFSQDAMKYNYMQESSVPARIYVRSNAEWKLILEGKSSDNPMNYAFKILPGGGNIKRYYSSDYTGLTNTSFVIAEGSPTVSSDRQNLESQSVEVNFRIKINETDLLPAGAYPYNLEYRLISG